MQPRKLGTLSRAYAATPVVLVLASLFQADRQDDGEYLMLAALFAGGAAFLFRWGTRLDRTGR